MGDNVFNEMNFDSINNLPDDGNDNNTKGCLFLIMFLSKKLWSTIILLLIAWVWDIRLWQSIVLTIIAAVNLLLPNTRDNEIMGWVRLAMIVIASLVTILLF
ncbi:MAG: hypothetical protein IKW82_00535 [Bacteroidales bacterium]|jgi:hypothetical protein|nr:hypothetical protein [Bacteroidales bacterium]